MKIAIDCRMLQCSGIGTFLKGALNELIKHKEISFVLVGKENDLLGYRQHNTKFIPCDVPIFSVKELIGFPVTEINKCDCFFSPNYNIPSGIRVPVFSTIHDVLFLDFPNLTGTIGRLIRKLAVSRAVRLSAHIFTVSEFSKSRILHHTATAKPISVCYNGADSVLNTSECNPSINIEGAEYYIFVGNIKPHKGLGTLLDAFEKVSIRNAERKLIIVGSQANFKTSDPTITHRISKMSSLNKIIFTGYVDDDKLIKLIKNAYCLVLPSEYEGFGLPPLEAMQLGTPVIISDIPVFKELYQEFPVTFFRATDADSLANAMISPMSRVSLSDEQRGKYTYKKTADKILSDIKSYFQNK